jgi:hypothetical protein
MGEANHSIVAAAFASDDAAMTAIRALAEAGVASQWRVGATDGERAAKIALAVGARADLDPTDPLAGVAGLATGEDAASGVNIGAVVGGVAGALTGFAAGATPLGTIMPVDANLRGAACALLFFAIGVAAGGVLGGAFGRRPSTHAGFRLIDAMEAGDVALLAFVDVDRIEEARRALESAGASEIIAV